MGTQKMAKEHAIIKDVKAVESLGCVSVICSDKTRTLTQNRMTVQQVYVNNRLYPPENLNPEFMIHRYFLYDGILTNDAACVGDRPTGDPTEIALIQMGRRIGIDEQELRRTVPRIGELPFDSERKLMSTVHQLDGELILFTKGAVDVLLPRVTDILTGEGVRPFRENDRQRILEQNLDFSRQGLRVLTFAYRKMKTGETLSLKSETGYTFLGMAAVSYTHLKICFRHLPQSIQILRLNR